MAEKEFTGNSGRAVQTDTTAIAAASRGAPAGLDAPLRAGGRRVEYRRGRFWNREGQRIVRVEGKQSSGSLTSIAEQDVLVRVDVGQKALKAGTKIRVLALNDELGYTEEFKSG